MRTGGGLVSETTGYLAATRKFWLAPVLAAILLLSPLIFFRGSPADRIS